MSRRSRVFAVGLVVLLLSLGARAASSDDKHSSVDTPLGPIKAHSKGVPLFVPGIPDYPRGHRTSNDVDGDGADVTLKMPFVSMKFVALRFETDDSMDQVMAFYKSKLASLGAVTVSEGGPNTDLDHFSWASRPGDRTLSVNDNGKAHLVALRTKGKGCQFALISMDFK